MFSSSQSLNDYLAKGPTLLKQSLGILLRFRQHKIGFIGDISKMYHSIDIPLEYQMIHLFLWRNLETRRIPDTYAITALNMGDKPSATIAQIALKKTAEMASKDQLEAKEIILDNSYMDDIMGSNNSMERTKTILKDAETILLKGGFKIKNWMISGESTITIKSEDQKQVQLLLHVNGYENGEKVLGLCWSTVTDNLSYDIKGSIKFNKMKVNKRITLSAINSIYDPLGLLSPFTVKTKNTHEETLGTISTNRLG